MQWRLYAVKTQLAYVTGAWSVWKNVLIHKKSIIAELIPNMTNVIERHNMEKFLIRIPTAGMSHEDWLKHRSSTIGGSDAAAIIGLSAWASPYSVWAEKTGRLPPKEDNEAMRQGRDLEQYVADRWCEATGKKVRKLNAILKNPAFPFAHANVDRMVICENAGLECKTTSSMNLKRFRDGDYPDNYYAQCVHYMAVTGAERWYLAVLVLNKGFYHFTIERDQAEIDALMMQEAKFWDYIDLDEAPPVDGSEATTETLQTIYSEANDGHVELFGREPIIREFCDLKEQAKIVDQQLGEIKQTLMIDMGFNESGVCGPYTVNWKNQSRSTFDAKAFANANPDIDLTPYYKTSEFRKFEIREVKP